MFTPWSLTITLQNGIFSSIVASFIIEIYKTLIPASSSGQAGQQTAQSPSSIAVRINIVLFLSLLLSISSAVSCALIQQWCNEYLVFARPRGAPHECGRVRTYLFQGLQLFQMRRFMYGTHVLLHISVFLFFWAISDYFFTVYPPFGLVTRYTLIAAAMVYILLSVSPLIFSNSPYNTPMTTPLRAGGIILRIILRIIIRIILRITLRIIRPPSSSLLWHRNQHFEEFGLAGFSYYKGIHFDRARLYSVKAEERAEELEAYAMKWLFTENDFSDKNMDTFLEALPGYVSSNQTEKGQLNQYLTAEPILSRIKEHVMTCATSAELSDDESISRMSSCVKALECIFKYSRQCKEGALDELKELQSQKMYIQTLIGDFQALCGTANSLIALRASCIRALVVQDLLSQLVPKYDSRTSGIPPFPVSLIPINTFFFPKDNTGTLRQLDEGRTPLDEEIKKIWKSLLHDGPLTNLTILAQAIFAKRHAPPPTLSFCWKTLDILLKQLGTIHSEEHTMEPTRAQMNFDKLHENIRAYIQADERGFRVDRVRPLLNILDIFARGRRLSMVLSGHPKYYNIADVVFGKEYLRNGDLLEAFAYCLPRFIWNNTPEVCGDFMEKVVRYDDLWTSLQVNLGNTERSDSPTPDKLRIFENCCTVIDLAFSVLEDSKEVDWRGLEFWSLLQHFDSFITHCFKDAIMGRDTSFRVSIIKARFCNGLLGQFQSDLEREGTLSFRSQWEAASLARLISALGLRDKDDAEFWNSYTSGGHFGPDNAKFTEKFVEMINKATRDGPLLIFCQLGHLAASALPLDQSGLELKDIKSVLKLQRKVIKNRRLPLNRASDTVWEALSQLRQQVNDLYGKNTGKDKKTLRRLLRAVDYVYNLRREESLVQSEPAEGQDPKSPAVANSSSFSESRHNRFGFASESIAVSGGPSIGALTGECEDGFGRARSLLIFRAFIDLLPERSVDMVLDDRTTHVRPESPQSFDSGSHGLSSLHPTIQGTSGVRFMERSIAPSPLAIRPVIPYSPMEDARPRRTHPSTRRAGTDPGFGATRPSLGVSTSATLTSRRDAPTDLLDFAISSPPESPDLSDESQSGAE